MKALTHRRFANEAVSVQKDKAFAKIALAGIFAKRVLRRLHSANRELIVPVTLTNV